MQCVLLTTLTQLVQVMASATSPGIPERVKQSMPEKPTGLLLEDVTYAGWAANHRAKNRFAVVNAHDVMEKVHVSREDVVKQIGNAIDDIQSSPWEYPDMDWTCSSTTVPERVFGNRSIQQPAIYFSRAAIMIVAIDLAAKHRVEFPWEPHEEADLTLGQKTNRRNRAAEAAKVDIYKTVKILPVSYYIEGFDTRMYKALASIKGGAEGALRRLNMPGARTSVLSDLADGYCLSKWAGGRLRDYLRDDMKLTDVGAVRFTDDNGHHTKDAARYFITPRSLTANEIAEIAAIV